MRRITLHDFWHGLREGVSGTLLDSLAVWRVGFRSDEAECDFRLGGRLKLKTDLRFEISDSNDGGESVLVNGAVFKTVSETVRTGSGRFDSYTPPP